MIQRIQSLYLAIALILMLFVGLFPIGELLSGEDSFLFFVKGVEAVSDGSLVYSGWPIVVMLLIIGLIQIVTIFGYKRRMVQMRLSIVNIVLMVFFLPICWFFIGKISQMLSDATYSFKIVAVFPVVSAILNCLAARAILKDEFLVRSVDRIR